MFKNKQGLIFAGTSVILAVVLAVFLFKSINFLFEEASAALAQNFSEGQKNTSFNLEGLKQLGIIQ